MNRTLSSCPKYLGEREGPAPRSGGDLRVRLTGWE